MVKVTKKATVIFDGLCSICCLFRRFVERRSSKFRFIPYQNVDFESSYPEVGLERARRAVYLVGTDGHISSAGAAVAAILKGLSLFWKTIGVVISLPFVIILTEMVYRLVARHRNLAAKLLNLKPQSEICE